MKKLTNGVIIPMLGLGTFLVTDEDIAYETVRYALSIGYRHIDTAQMYGNEHIIGKALRDSGIPRNEIFITTKQKGHSTIVEMRKAFYHSLEALQTDYIDLYLIHWPNHDKAINVQTWSLFEELYKEKKVRAIGVSNFKKHHFIGLLDSATILPMVNQIELHPGLNQLVDQSYFEAMGVAVISYGPMMRGGVFKGLMAEKLGVIAKRHNSSIAQIVIAWGLTRGIIMIPKSVTPLRIKENYESRLISLSLEEIRKINSFDLGARVYSDPDTTSHGAFKESYEN